MRRGIAVGLLAGVAFPAQAYADAVIRAEPSNRYATPEVTIDPGEKVTFQNGDVVAHDVTSEQKRADGKRLFASAILDGGQSGPVEGAAGLQPGEYAFFCSLHAQMKGKLTMTGTPVATVTPTPTAQPDTAAPEVTLSAELRANSLRRTKQLTLGLRSNETARVVLSVRVGSRRLGSRALNVGEGSHRLAIALRNVRAIRRGRKLRVVAVATDAAGNRRRTQLVARLP